MALRLFYPTKYKKKHCTRLLTTSGLSFESCFSSHTSNHEQGEFSTELSICKYKKKKTTNLIFLS